MIAVVPACSDFLDVDPWGSSETWESETDVENAIAALYYAMQNEEGVGGRGMMWLELAGDDLVTGRTRASADQIKMFRMPANNSDDQKQNWPEMYKINARANNIITIVPSMNLSTSYKNKAVGTAYFFRGFSMLWLAPWYGDNGPNGGIPIILETTNPGDIDSPRPTSVLRNYDQIISDMRTAAGLLPYFSELSADEYGYPHKAAAWAFAARAALYAAQYDDSYYDIVIEMCTYVENLTGVDRRDLFNDGSANPFANLWRRENNFSSEYIFSILGNASYGPKFHGMSFQNAGWNLYNTWGYYQPTYELYQAYESGDLRREATILMPGEEITFVGKTVLFGGQSSDGNWTNISSTSGMTFRKFMSPWEGADCKGKEVNTNGDNSSNTLATCLMRYADVMLMKAEALIWKNGEGNGEAKTLLNKIRARAGLPQTSDGSKADLKRQRRCELAFEYQPSRFIDIVRWGDAVSTFAQPTYGVTSSWDSATQTVTWTPVEMAQYSGRSYNPNVNHVFPIPQDAFEDTENLKQNAGY